MSSLYRRNGIYWLSFRHNDRGHCISLKTRDRATAIYLKAQKDKELIEGKSIIPDKKTLCLPILDKYKKDFQHSRTKKTNEDQYKKISDFLDWSSIRSFNQITQQRIKDYLNHCVEKKLSFLTINTIIQNLKTWLNYCVKNRHIFENPAANTKKFRVPQRDVRFLSKDEIRAILEAAQIKTLYADSKPTLYPVIATGIYTGMRQQELFNLGWKDVDFKQGLVRVINKAGFTTKDKENRAIPFHKDLKTILRPLKRKDGRCFDVTNQRRIFRRIKKAAKITGIGWHTFRHTFASHALMSGVPIATVSKWMGHADIKTTMIYSHLLKDHQSDEIKKLTF